MTTRGGESEGGEAELRANSQTEVFQDRRLRTERRIKSNQTRVLLFKIKSVLISLQTSGQTQRI